MRAQYARLGRQEGAARSACVTCDGKVRRVCQAACSCRAAAPSF